MTQIRHQIEDSLGRIGGDVKETGRRVWLAGLGALGAVDTEGREMFDQLVERGRAARDASGSPVESATHRVKTLGAQIERQVEERTTQALHRFGVPARRDIEQLSLEVERLTRKIETLAADA
ncbi:MAG: phasin family protein [Acidobacteriota bacterium]